jgi:hypothetical protein
LPGSQLPRRNYLPKKNSFFQSCFFFIRVPLRHPNRLPCACTFSCSHYDAVVDAAFLEPACDVIPTKLKQQRHGVSERASRASRFAESASKRRSKLGRCVRTWYALAYVLHRPNFVAAISVKREVGRTRVELFQLGWDDRAGRCGGIALDLSRGRYYRRANVPSTALTPPCQNVPPRSANIQDAAPSP